jgi:hypothetical protein
MSKEFQEPEEKKFNDTEDAIIMDDFNPLDEAINEKEYTKHNVKVNPNDFNKPIPEPSFIPPPMTGMVNENEKPKDIRPKEPFNPQAKQMTTKDKRLASKRVADMLMTAYKWVNRIADSSLQFNERKISKMVSEGQLDLSVQVPISPTDTISAGEFIQEYNEQSRNTVVVTQEFEEEVMPVLIDVLEEEGITMTKKQELAFLVGQDIAVKGFMMYQSLNVKKDMLKMMQEFSTLRQPSYVAPAPAPTPAPQPTYTEPIVEQPTFTPPPQRSHDPVNNVNDFVNEMTGGINPQFNNPTDVPVPSDVQFTPFEDEDMTDYEEPKKPTVKIISSAKPKGKGGRPKKIR